MGSAQYAQLKSKIVQVKSLKAQLKKLTSDKSITSLVILYDKRFTKKMTSIQGQGLHKIAISSNESSKSLNSYVTLLNRLSKLQIDRHACVVTIGGGVVSDLGGFVASTYLRGLQWVNVPTTLLAMVDAGYGGKTGINFLGYKNRIGTFYAPQEVWIDLGFLETLSSQEILSGLGEVFKYALLFDKSLFVNLTSQKLKSYLAKPALLQFIVKKSLKHKSSVVSKDPRERLGARELLNLGHTFAHALEFTQKNTPHGQAVAMGLQYAAYMSAHKKWLNQKDLLKILNALQPIVPVNIKSFNMSKLWTAMTKDKKNKAQQVRMVGLRGVAKPKTGMIITQKDHAKVLYDLAFRNVIEVTR